MKSFFSLGNIAAGFVAVLVGFTSSAVIIFQAATMVGANSAEISSWIFALGISIASTCIFFSLYYKMPILTGWSTPGAALLVTSLSGLTLQQSIGAFVFAAMLTILAGVTGIFEKIINHIPKSLTAAMLAGILLHFGMNVFVAMQSKAPLVISMLIIYLIGKRFFPRYGIVIVLLIGVAIASMQGLFNIDNFHFALATPIFTKPEFSWTTLFSAGIPLFIVTMTSQNITGIAILNTSGYKPKISPIITIIGIITLILAPLGCYSICLAAITAAICTGKEADPNPNLRYKSTLFAGFCWLTIGIFGATVVSLFFSFPNELIIAVAGMALFSTIASSLKTSLENDKEREPAIITILISASGLTLFGIGSAFWGLVAGICASFLLNWNTNEVIEANLTTGK
ncbi:MAG: hypothetical protein A3E88_06815 [Legionellales bacterium RIFCSPHIGHO2_12_FULL_35_11]|nr:MAG: hypothetical protein A3E88_06815 [Legionellales bacterium RIFCSPHIGHO2_12_FULL_35_11]